MQVSSGTMKLWLKYLLGIALGLILDLVVPAGDASAAAIAFLSTLALRIGTYAFVPLLLASMPVAVYELYEDRRFWKTAGKTMALFLAATPVFSAMGIAAGWIVSPSRISLLADTASNMSLNPAGILLEVFPSNWFTILVRAGEQVLPLAVLATVLGLALSHDRILSKPVVSVLDPLSGIFYHINSFLAEVLGILLIAISLQAFRAAGAAFAASIYVPLLLATGVLAGVSVLVVIPLVLFLLGGKRNPYPRLYAFLGPALAALVSGDLRFSAGVLAKHAKESAGIRRRSAMVTIPAGLLAGRAGTVMVTASAFVVILSSYSSLGLSLPALLWVLALSPLVIVSAGASTGNPAMATLALLCALFGKGYENGYLLMLPIAFPLMAAGALVDTFWIGAAGVILAGWDGHREEIEPRHHI